MSCGSIHEQVVAWPLPLYGQISTGELSGHVSIQQALLLANHNGCAGTRSTRFGFAYATLEYSQLNGCLLYTSDAADE